jgi:putative YhbY family RNA-binding protein
MTLTGADKRALRALGNGLKATIYIGKQGVSEDILQAIVDAHEHAELIKLKVLDTCPLDRHEAAAALEERSGSQLVQVLGRTILLFRRHPKKPVISLPSSPLAMLLALLGSILLAAAAPLGAQPASPGTSPTTQRGRTLYVGGNPAAEPILPPALPWNGASKRLLLPANDPWATPFEKGGLDVTPTTDETVAWLRKLCDASSELAMLSIGKSATGRDVWMVVASAEHAFTAEAMRKSARPALLVQCALHAGETDGKDAGMMLLRDMTARGTQRALLDGANVLFVPMLNVEGHDRFGPYGRINQRGPAETGWRTNARNLNLNRDFGKLDAPETASLVGVLNAWEPDLYVDIHVTDGVDYQYDVTWGYNGPHAYSPNIAAWLDGLLTPAARQDLIAMGHIPGRTIFAVNDRNLADGIWVGTSGLRFSHGYGDARHLATVLVENHSLKPYVQRVLGTYVFLESVLRTLADHGRELKRATEEDRAARRGSIPLTWRLPDTPPETIALLGVRPRVAPSAVSGGLAVQWLGEPDTIRAPVIAYTEPELVASRPKAYWIPAGWPEVIERLKQHGVRVEEITEPREIAVTMYRVADAAIEAEPSEGHARVTGTPNAESRTEYFPAGSVRVSTDQPLGDVAALLLEPASPESFFQWGFFLSVLNNPEYVEPYVMEPMASRMLAEDPRLAQAFLDTLAVAGREFTGNPRARLQWFYRRTPFFDERWRLYPVAREE